MRVVTRLWAMLIVVLVLTACDVGSDISTDSQAETSTDVYSAFDAGRILLKPAILIAGEEVAGAPLLERMEDYQTPGVGLAFFDAEGLVWEASIGFADPGQTTRLRPDHILQGASISKAITAIAVMRLVEQDLLDLDTDVRTYLTSWELPTDDAFDRPVTLRRLLSHSAGITVHGFEGYEQGQALPNLQQILSADGPANNNPVLIKHEPGAGFVYSGGGYQIIQQVMEDVTGLPYRQLMEDLIFRPLGMTRTSFDIAVGETSDLEQFAYANSSESGVPPGGWRVYPEAAAAGIWTTPSDLAQLGTELLQIEAGRNGGILSPSSLDEMISITAGNWGLGFRLSADEQFSWFGHGGNNLGFSSDFLIASEVGQGLVVMTNGDAELGALVGEIRRAVAQEYGWTGLGPEVRELADVSFENLVRLTGSYQEVSGFTFSVLMQGDQLFIDAEPLGPEPVRLYPKTETLFFVLPSGLPFEFYVDEQKNVIGVRIASRDAKRLN